MTPVEDNEAMQIGPDPDKLFVYHRQQLSAMLDGELSPDEAKFMLRRLQHDSDLADCWERWQVCGDMLRGQRNTLLPNDFAQRVALAVAGGAAVSADAAQVEPASRPRFARWGGGAAIAASVALLAVFASRQLPEPGALPDAAAPAPLVAAASAPAAPLAVDQIIVDPPAVADAMADAGEPAPAAPLPDASIALAAAVAVAEVPRRASERRSRAQSQRAASNRRQQATGEAPAAVAVASQDAGVPVIRLPEESAAGDPFAMPQSATARPWPRALLSAGSAFTVAEGRLESREPGFEPFRPSADILPWQQAVPAADPAHAGATQP